MTYNDLTSEQKKHIDDFINAIDWYQNYENIFDLFINGPKATIKAEFDPKPIHEALMRGIRNGFHRDPGDLCI